MKVSCLLFNMKMNNAQLLKYEYVLLGNYYRLQEQVQEVWIKIHMYVYKIPSPISPHQKAYYVIPIALTY